MGIDLFFIIVIFSIGILCGKRYLGKFWVIFIPYFIFLTCQGYYSSSSSGCLTFLELQMTAGERAITVKNY